MLIGRGKSVNSAFVFAGTGRGLLEWQEFSVCLSCPLFFSPSLVSYHGTRNAGKESKEKKECGIWDIELI